MKIISRQPTTDMILVSVGASGAVYGLLFFCIIDNTLRIFTITNLKDKIIQFLIMLLVIPYFVMSVFVDVDFSGHIDHAAHGGGALMGILIAILLCEMPGFITSRVPNGQERIKLIALIAIVGYVSISLFIFYLLKPISLN
jgi:membrane associated rhomboid family serine protease